MVRLRGEVGVDGNEVGLAEQVCEVAILRLEFLLNLGGRPVDVMVADAHGEAAGTAGHSLPDPAEAHYAEGLVVDVLTQHHEWPPGPGDTGAEETVPFGDPPGRGHHQGERGVCCGLG